MSNALTSSRGSLHLDRYGLPTRVRAVHVRAHEPHLALFVEDADPLLFYRAIAAKALQALSPGGTLWFEGHHVHVPAVADLLRKSGYSDVSVINDLSGSPRFVRAVR